MKRILALLFQVSILLMPWALRRPLLNLLPGVYVEKGAKIGASLVLARNLRMCAGSEITHFTFVNTIDRLNMHAYSKIGRSNWITGANSDAAMFSDIKRECVLELGRACTYH